MTSSVNESGEQCFDPEKVKRGNIDVTGDEFVLARDYDKLMAQNGRLKELVQAAKEADDALGTNSVRDTPAYQDHARARLRAAIAAVEAEENEMTKLARSLFGVAYFYDTGRNSESLREVYARSAALLGITEEQMLKLSGELSPPRSEPL